MQDDQFKQLASQYGFMLQDVQREEDIKGAQSFQANSYALLIGWQFKFN